MLDPAQSLRSVRVLERDPDLAAGLPPDVSARAEEELVAPLVRSDWTSRSGHWGLGDRGLGLLIVDGLLLREVRMLSTSSAELLGTGDLLRPADVDADVTLPAPAEIAWTVLAPLELAVLDEAFLAAACRYPSLLSRLTGRAIGRAKALALHEAVTNLKHVESRLLVQFWHMAERWGRVGRDGVTVALPLTHEQLGKLVGATRPSVTTALGRLADRGQLTRAGGGWRLSHASRTEVSSL